MGLMVGVMGLAGCAFGPSHPCGDAGEPAREVPLDKKLQGNKQCTQRKDASGRFVNDGKYVEWHPSGNRALQGEYKMGKKDGKWTEWDDKGKVISQKWFEDGVEAPARGLAGK